MFHLDDKGFQFLLSNFSLFCQSIQDGSSNICKIFKNFGIEREPTSLEALVCFTAQQVKPVFDKHHSSLKKCRSGLLPCDFRVGGEVTNISFAVLLHDLILTGNECMIPAEPCKRSILFEFLLLDSVRHKLKDYKVVTPLQKVASNDVSLTCSRSLMTFFNKAGLAFSYTKDLKDSTLARKL